jgi:transcriptional regulator with XRE-family HTH domain
VPIRGAQHGSEQVEEQMTTRLDNERTEIPAILSTLKRLLKAKGILYSEVARRMGLSETTVKRYLTGHGLTVEILEILCHIVDLRLSDAFAMAREDIDATSLTLEEERELAKEPFLAALFYMLAQGLAPDTLQRDFRIGDADLNRYLTTLDRLGLIRLFPHNRVRVSVNRNFSVRPGGPLMRLAHQTLLKGFFEKFDVDEPDWSFAYAKLSKSSMELVRDLFKKFIEAFEQIADGDRELPIDRAQWNGLLFMIRPIDVGSLRDWPKQPAGQAR